MRHLRKDTINEFITIFYFMILRLVSFSLEKVDDLKVSQKNFGDNEKSTYNFRNFIFYIYYPTFNFVSPFVPFKNFISCVSFNIF